MENNEDIVDFGMSGSNNLIIDAQARDFLISTAKWAKFLSILGFIFIGIMVIAAFSIGSILAMLPNGGNIPTGVPFALFTVIYLIGAAIYFFPVLFLFNFSRKMLNSLESNIQFEFNTALSNLKSHYKFIGVLTVIIMAFYVVALLIAVLVGASI